VLSAFGTIIRKNQVFFDSISDNNFTKDFVTLLTPKLYYPEQKIIKRGTQSHGIYFIIAGEVVAYYEGNPIIVLNEGSYFGDDILLDLNSNVDIQ
jgi:CRP-like cAMP-binding protein